jgi:hypothetical protein
VQIAQVMRQIAQGTTPGVVVENFTITPGVNTITLTAIARDYAAYNRWRWDLLQDPDFTGVPQMTGPGAPGAPAAAGGGGGRGGGGYPGAGGGGRGGYPGGGGAAGGAGGGGSFYFPGASFPGAIPVTVTLTLAKGVDVPNFNPSAAVSADTSGGSGMGGASGMGGYPGAGGYPGGAGGGYPGSGGGGYPGSGGGGGAYPGAGGTAPGAKP